eukprot:TRINITY_DN64016_c0_g1_i1.p1 TRINITY_DN64016_c0_g1~~TRINITY_DN64016_c0_g1_i1.p1  ORF type:complete len:648 (+),score=130.91 TRINITY_DN64016_c0_g1_i1:41-1984(+)
MALVFAAVLGQDGAAQPSSRMFQSSRTLHAFRGRRLAAPILDNMLSSPEPSAASGLRARARWTPVQGVALFTAVALNRRVRRRATLATEAAPLAEVSESKKQEDEEGSERSAGKSFVRQVTLWPGIDDTQVDFGGLQIPKRLSDAFIERGIAKAAPIQELVLSRAAHGEHVIIHAPTGGGKTLSYLLPMLARLQPTMHVGAQALVFVPTPELALQVTRELQWLIKALCGSDGVCWFNPQVPQELACQVLLSRSTLWDAIRQDTAILVTTPGLVLSELKSLKNESRRFQETLSYFLGSNVHCLIADEIDALTPGPKKGTNFIKTGAVEQVMNYVNDVVRFRYRNRPVQLITASATANGKKVASMLERVLARKWPKRRDAARRELPVLIQHRELVARVAAPPGKTRDHLSHVAMPRGITHALALMEHEDLRDIMGKARFELILRIVVNLRRRGNVIVFVPERVKLDAMVIALHQAGIEEACKYRSEVGLGQSTQELADPSLEDTRTVRTNPNKRGLPAEQNSDPSAVLQKSEDFVAEIAKGERRVLVAKMDSGRGIDLQDVEYVVLFDKMGSAGDYLHLAGRTGRMGKTGTAITIMTEKEREAIAERIEARLNIKFEEWDVDSGRLAPGRLLTTGEQFSSAEQDRGRWR